MPQTEKQGGRICRRCLLYEMAESAEYQNVYAYIEGLDDEIRAPKALYEKRLSCCKSCGSEIKAVKDN